MPEWEVFVAYASGVVKGYFIEAATEEEATRIAAGRFPTGQVESAREVQPGKDIRGNPR